MFGGVYVVYWFVVGWCCYVVVGELIVIVFFVEFGLYDVYVVLWYIEFFGDEYW